MLKVYNLLLAFPEFIIDNQVLLEDLELTFPEFLTDNQILQRPPVVYFEDPIFFVLDNQALLENLELTFLEFLTENQILQRPPVVYFEDPKEFPEVLNSLNEYNISLKKTNSSPKIK